MFTVTELLIGLLFGATVQNAPVHVRLENESRGEEARRIHSALVGHDPSWTLRHLEKECGFLAHIEGKPVIASLTEDSLDVGLRSEASMSELREPLPARIGAL